MRITIGLLVMGMIAVQACQSEENEGVRHQGLSGSQLGMVIDNFTGTATVFNADTNTILGTVDGLGGGLLAAGDCAITPDGTRGFFTRFNSGVTVADLTATPPTVAGPPNPIAISNPGEDVSLSPDGKFLVVCDGLLFVPVSVIDVATQTEISTFDTGFDCDSVEVCSDGSVLVTSITFSLVQRLTLSPSGTLSDTGELQFSGSPMNVYCSPSGKSGVVVDFFENSATSFTIPGLTPVTTVDLGDSGLSGAFNHRGDRVYFRTGTDSVAGFTFDDASGAIGAPLFRFGVAPPLSSFFGMDQLAVHPSDASIYVSQPGSVQIFNAQTGAPTGSVVGDSMNGATGVCFGARAPNKPPVAVCEDRNVAADATCHASVSVDGGSFDPDEGDTITCTQVPSGPFDVGTTTVTLTCTDAHGQSSSCIAAVTVADTSPPVVVTRDAGALWPPNHKYRRINLDQCIVSAQDACTGAVDASTATITCCTSDEPDNGSADGNTSNDCVIVDRDSVDVRAERAGNGNGRVYTIHFTVADSSGNGSSHTCHVTVPHSQNGNPAVDDGPATTCQ